MELENIVAVGDLVAQKYRVEKRIGAGAMGVVYAARHEELDERVALKFLSPLLVSDETARARFQREAKNAFSLKGEHVARVFDVGRLESGAPYIVMEFLEGETLKKYVDAHGRLSLDESISILVQTCEGVAEAHGRGVVHRDLKPENVFLTKLASGSPIVKVLDFGISKASATDARPGTLAITTKGQVVGTPRYMSPEQFEKSTDVSAESDVWSLGVLAYWLLSGKFPFDDGTPQLALAALFSGKPPRNLSEHAPNLDRDLVQVVMTCLARKKNERYAHADALKRALMPFARASLAIPSVRKRADSVPETHRSILSPKDAPTLEQPRTDLVKDAVMPPPTERDSAAARNASETLPTTKRVETGETTKRTTNETERGLGPDAKEPKTPMVVTRKREKSAATEEDGPTADEGSEAARKVAAIATDGGEPAREGSSEAKMRTVRMPNAGRAQDSPLHVAKTLPLGMVYNAAKGSEPPVAVKVAEHDGGEESLPTPLVKSEPALLVRSEPTPLVRRSDGPPQPTPSPSPAAPAPTMKSDPPIASNAPPELEVTAKTRPREEDLALPMSSQSRARVFIVLAIFVFVGAAVWFVTHR